VKKVGLPLLPQLGLEPNIYYIPPIHVGNISFLRMLFGPQVDQAIQTYNKAIAGKDIELVAVLTLNVSTDRIMKKFKVIGSSEVAGYDEQGHEVVRVPLKEPAIVRPFYDERLQVYRHNIT
jgi:nitrate reductase beta subunit